MKKINKPYSKLPFSAYANTSLYIVDANDNIVAKRIELASDAEYITWACNNIQNAIELLNKVQDLLSSNDYDVTDGDLVDQLWALNIDMFLKKVESEY